MVTSADSQVRIIHGLNVIKKYKGIKNNVKFQGIASGSLFSLVCCNLKNVCLGFGCRKMCFHKQLYLLFLSS